MSDRIPSDHDAVTSHRVHLEAVGRTGRLRIPLPADLECSVEDVVRLSIEGDAYHAQVTTDLEGDPVVEGAYANARMARAEDGENALAAWVEQSDLAAGDALVWDVVTTGYAYGLRRPGERVVYRAVDPPGEGLTDIARNLE